MFLLYWISQGKSWVLGHCWGAHIVPSVMPHSSASRMFLRSNLPGIGSLSAWNLNTDFAGSRGGVIGIIDGGDGGFFPPDGAQRRKLQKQNAPGYVLPVFMLYLLWLAFWECRHISLFSSLLQGMILVTEQGGTTVEGWRRLERGL